MAWTKKSGMIEKKLPVTSLLFLLLSLFVFRIPLLTTLLILFCYNVLYLLAARSPGILKGSRPLPLGPSPGNETTLLPGMAGNVVFLAWFFLLLFSGKAILTFWWPYPFNLLALIVHFVAGMGLIYLILTYLVMKMERSRKRIGEPIADFLAGMALFVLLLLAFEIILPEPAYVISSSLILLLVFALTWRKGRFLEWKDWFAAWLPQVLLAPLSLLIIFIFAYVPFRLHFANPDAWDSHAALGYYAVYAILFYQTYQVVRCSIGANHGKRLSTLSRGLGGMFLAVLLPLGLMGAVYLVSKTGLDIQTIHDTLLPLPPASSYTEISLMPPAS